MKHSSIKLLLFLPSIVYMFIFLYMANRPPQIIRSGRFNDKVLHFLAYGLLTLLLYIPIKYNFKFKYYAILTFFITVSFGLIDEINQAFIPVRTFDLKDLLADSIGSITMIVLLAIFFILKQKFMQK